MSIYLKYFSDDNGTDVIIMQSLISEAFKYVEDLEELKNHGGSVVGRRFIDRNHELGH